MGVLMRDCTTGDDRIRALTTAPRIKPTSIFLRSARRPNPGRRSTYRRGIIVQTTGTGSAVTCSGLLYVTVAETTAQKEVEFKVEQTADGKMFVSVSPFQF
jgi:hypothetical protein